MSFPNDFFPSHFSGQFSSPQKAVVVSLFSNAIPTPPQQFSHNPRDEAQRAECLLQSFPHHPLDRSSAKIYLSRFIERHGFLFDTFADDNELPHGVIMRQCPKGVSPECPKGGFQCLWCMHILPTSSAAFDCIRLHIGHRPHRCASACPTGLHGCGLQFSRNVDLKAHQRGL